MQPSALRRFSLAIFLIALLATSLFAPGASAAASVSADPLGQIDDAMAARLHEVFLAGKQKGRRAAVFAKVGDSITASGSFLADIGKWTENLGGHSELRGIINFYRATTVDHDGGWAHSSFNRASLAARYGWTGADILGLAGETQNGPSPLQQEYAALNPAVSIIMFGTNDLDRTGLPRFVETLNMVVDQTLDAGIIPILSTIPDRMDYPAAAERTLPFNDAIRQLAAAKQVPLIDYWQALQPLPNHGLQRDMVHPSIYPTRNGAVVFTQRGLRYGWTLRNYLTLQMLKQIRERVIG